MLSLYSFLVALLWPLVFLGFVWRFGLVKTLKGLGERFGLSLAPAPPAERGRVWVHAASVGEVRAVEPFLRAVGRRFPGLGRCLTTTTVAGKRLAEDLGLAEEVRLAPVDLPFCVNRFLSAWRPRALVLVETELWPNWIRTARSRRVPLALVNGRISDRSFGSYRRLRFFWRPLLEGFAAIGVQSPGQAERFGRIGAPAPALRVTGNLKFDVPLPDLSRRPDLLRRYGFSADDRVWVCGSTHAGEEGILLEAFRGLRQRGVPAKLVLAPRHVDRVPELARRLEQAGFAFRLRSALSSSGGPFDALLVDTVGELPEIYGAATWAFVGGSLIPQRGGQNPLEPARWGVPVAFGPHMKDFREMVDLFLREGGAFRAADGKALEERLFAWFRDPEAARRAGEAARRVAESQGGALDKNLALLADVLGRGGLS